MAENSSAASRGFQKLLQFHKLILAVEQFVASEVACHLLKFKDQGLIRLALQEQQHALRKQTQAIQYAILQSNMLILAQSMK